MKNTIILLTMLLFSGIGFAFRSYEKSVIYWK